MVPPSRSTFGPFELDPAERLLLQDGRPVPLTPKSLDLLILLVERAGHLVTKDEILDRTWPGVVVEEKALSVTISRLRAAMGEAGRGYIEAVPGHGYRFVAPVVVAHNADIASDFGPRVEDVVTTVTLGGDGVAVRAAAQTAPRTRRVRRATLTALAGLVVVVGAIAFAGAGRLWDDPAPTTTPREPNEEAVLAYRRGTALWEARQWELLPDALAQFKRAVALQPDFAAAHVGEAQVYAVMYGTSGEAEAAARRALALQPDLAGAWATLGFVNAFHHWDWSAAEAAFARAGGAGATNVTALQWLAGLRMVQAQSDEAVRVLRRAVSLQPDYAPLHADLCEAHYYRRDWNAAFEACDRALALSPRNEPALTNRFWTAVAAGREDLAVRYVRGAYPVGVAPPAGVTDFPAHVRVLMRVYHNDPATYDDAYLARLHAHLGSRDSALVYIERAVERREYLAPYMRPDPMFASLRGDPRWVAAMRRMGF